MRNIFSFVIYFLGLICLLLYSYTQVDLGLVITRVPWLYIIEKKFQYIGYFNRPLSTLIFILLVIFFTLSYVAILKLINAKKISPSIFWKILGITAVVLILCYNAFSYDLFNYIFDAKIVTHYQQNPYIHKALDYPTDPMLGFMHWTQRTYPYGPVWLGLTVPLSFIGFNYFLLTFYLFKLLIVGSYVGTVYFLYKILEKMRVDKPLYQLALFAFNPLVLFEWGVSAHNDGVMFFFAIWAIYRLMDKKFSSAFILLLLSIGIKFATVFLLPLFIIVLLKRKEFGKIDWRNNFFITFLLMLIPLFFVIFRTNFQPWYLLYLLVFLPLIPTKKVLQIVTSVIAILALGIYLSFLYTGSWHSPLFLLQSAVYYWLSVLSLIICVGFLLFKTKRLLIKA
ncbi:MAG TPA: hypothetical protein VMR41_03785 [Patescibacteria group bacterium]|nr:hypothetical protein [Patescibacteria group bacterium]